MLQVRLALYRISRITGIDDWSQFSATSYRQIFGKRGAQGSMCVVDRCCRRWTDHSPAAIATCTNRDLWFYFNVVSALWIFKKHVYFLYVVVSGLDLSYHYRLVSPIGCLLSDQRSTLRTRRLLYHPCLRNDNGMLASSKVAWWFAGFIPFAYELCYPPPGVFIVATCKQTPFLLRTRWVFSLWPVSEFCGYLFSFPTFRNPQFLGSSTKIVVSLSLYIKVMGNSQCIIL